ncbi:MAG: trigger factor [Bdellovibrionales bacterium]|nr:trigger factor [Bdellovibrionales bacterium]
MESIVKETKGLKRKLELKITEKEVDRCFLRNYQKIKQKVTLPGFRKGKAPLSAIKQNYKDKVLKEVLEDLFHSHYPSALKNTKTQVAGPPHLLNFNLQEGKEASLLLEVEIHPTVKVENYLNLELEKEKISVNETQVKESLERLRDSYSQFEENLNYKGPLKKGDFCTLNLSAFNSENIKVLNQENFLIEIGQNKLGEKFDEKLLGLTNEEEREFSFQFPDYMLPSSQNQNTTLKVKVKLIAFKNKKIPELNDEFAKKFKVSHVEELKEKIKQDLQKNLEQKEQENLENRLLKTLAKKNPLELPQTLIEDQKQRLKENTKKHLQIYKFSPKDQEIYLQKHEEEFQKEAVFSLHISYLVEQLIKDLKIQTNSEDIEKSLKESFPNKNPEDMKKELEKKNHWNQFLSHLTRKKLISYLLDQAKIIEK